MPDEDIVLKTPMGEIIVPFDREAVLKFVRDVNLSSEKEMTLREKEFCEYLGVEYMDELESEWLFWEVKQVPVMLHDLNTWMNENFKIERITSYANQGKKSSNVVHQKFVFPNQEKKKFATRATYYLQHKDSGVRYIWSLHPMDGVHIEVQILCNSEDDSASIDSVRNHFEDFVRTKGILKNNAFNADYTFLRRPTTTFEDVVLSEEQTSAVQRNIMNYVQNLSFYRERNLPTSRGIIITGPPGTGKTLTCSAIINDLEITIIYITSEMITEQGQIEHLYTLARGLSPTVVIVEDIDTLGGLDRRDAGNHPLLGEFLNCLNGVENNDGVITIATTNYPEHLDKALTRAGRFDVCIDFPVPNAELREHILKNYLGNMKTGKINLKGIVKETEGLTGAFLKEIVTLSTISAFEENGYDSKTKIEQKHLDEALEHLFSTRKDHVHKKTSSQTGFHH